MKMVVDASTYVRTLKKILGSRPPNEVFLYGPPDSPGNGTITCSILLKELGKETSFAKEIVQSWIEESLRLWVFRKAKESKS